MKNTWLAFLTIGFLAVITFIFFFLRTQPIELPHIDEETAGGKIDQPVVTFVNPSKGPASAKVTIIEYGDFECESCAHMSAAVETARQAYKDDVRVIWKNYPNESLHPQSTNAAIAAHCADRQGKFWEYHDILFAQQAVLSPNLYQAISEQLELDTDRFKDCVDSQDTLAVVQKDFEEAKGLGLSATPATYINGKLSVGAVDAAGLLSIIQGELQ